MRQKNLLKQIRNSVINGNVKEPFRSSDFEFLSKSSAFLAKHCLGNGKYSEYFERVARGYYKVLK